MPPGPTLYGELDPWPSREQLASVLRAGGFTVYVGTHSVRIGDLSHFVFDGYGTQEPGIDADADSVEEMLRDVAMVSAALTKAGIRHRFEVHDPDQGMVAYFHHRWPVPAHEPPA